MQAMSNIQQARDIYDPFNRGDIATVLGAFDLGIEWREAEGNPYEPSRRPRTAPGAITQNLFVKLGRTGRLQRAPRVVPQGGRYAGGRYIGAFKPTGQEPGCAGLPRAARGGGPDRRDQRLVPAPSPTTSRSTWSARARRSARPPH